MAEKKEYQQAKRHTKHPIYLKNFQTGQEIIKDLPPSNSNLFHFVNQMRRSSLDAQGKKPVRNDAGELRLGGRSKETGWEEHHECLFQLTGPLEIWIRLRK